MKRETFRYRLLAAIAILLIALLGGKQIYVWAQGAIPNPDRTVLPTVLKEHISAEDINQYNMDRTNPNSDTEPKANVLFLIDTSNAMMYTPKGKIPVWDNLLKANNDKLAQTAAATDQLVGQLTFGVGVRPGFIGGANDTWRHADHLGRDVDPGNNVDPTNQAAFKDAYYSGDPEKPYLLTFVDEKWANSPTLLEEWESVERVPNDSRLHQMKLIFMRMLEDTETMSKLRFALSTTHFSQTNYLLGADHISGGGVHASYMRRMTPAELKGVQTNPQSWTSHVQYSLLLNNGLPYGGYVINPTPKDFQTLRLLPDAKGVNTYYYPNENAASFVQVPVRPWGQSCPVICRQSF